MAIAAVVVSAVFIAAPAPASGQGDIGPIGVTALGRIQPKDGIRSVYGPAEVVMVVEDLRVDKGDEVKKGQLIALLDGAKIRQAEVDTAASAILELEAAVLHAKTELKHFESELKRFQTLRETEVVSESLHDSWEVRVDSGRVQVQLAEATVVTGRNRLSLAKALLERTRVRSPISGQVIDVHAREGERVGLQGILDLGVTDAMYAVAEVYETNIRSIKVGQRARVTSAALGQPLFGTVDRIAMKVGKVDVLGTDPAARTDARVIEVEVRLDKGAVVKSLTNLEVEVAFEKNVSR